MRCKSYVENRIRNLKGLMIKNHIDAVIIEKPENVKYFSILILELIPVMSTF